MSRPPRTLHGVDHHAFLRYYARAKQRRGEPVFCLQVGANDGRTQDPVHPFLANYGWAGLLVEPLVDVFEERLVPRYAGNPRITLANVAIGPQAGNLPFFRIAVSDAFWATGLSSFSRSTLERGLRRHMAKQGYEPPHKEGDFIEEVTVPTVTVDQLLRRYDVRALDVVCVDTEGFDFEILKLIDYERLHPEVVVFESRHLSAAEYGGALALLRSRGYWIGQHKFDTVASTVKYPARVRLMTRALGRVRKLTRKGRRRARRLVGRAVERMPAGWRRAGK